MNIIGICPYETPCGWCSKWDKECDKKIGYSRGLRAQAGIIDEAIDIPTEYQACWGCEKAGWSMPECNECNPENNFKWKRTKS